MSQTLRRPFVPRHFDAVCQLGCAAFIYKPEPSQEPPSMVSSNLLGRDLYERFKPNEVLRRH